MTPDGQFIYVHDIHLSMTPDDRFWAIIDANYDAQQYDDLIRYAKLMAAMLEFRQGDSGVQQAAT